jgi:HrpA-like RNA helicase
MKVKDQIIYSIQNNQVTIISGDTGCGKSTQVPKIIMKLDSTNKIICTQPRRIACVNLARRVAEELDVGCGQEVGYQIGLENSMSH